MSEVENTSPPWPKALERDVVKDGPVGTQFVLIPPGEFDMWWTEGPESAQRDCSQRVVRTRLAKAYELSQTEVTYEQFAKFVEATGDVTVAEKWVKLRADSGQPHADPKPTWRNPPPLKDTVDPSIPFASATPQSPSPMYSQPSRPDVTEDQILAAWHNVVFGEGLHSLQELVEESQRTLGVKHPTVSSEAHEKNRQQIAALLFASIC